MKKQEAVFSCFKQVFTRLILQIRDFSSVMREALEVQKSLATHRAKAKSYSIAIVEYFQLFCIQSTPVEGHKELMGSSV